MAFRRVRVLESGVEGVRRLGDVGMGDVVADVADDPCWWQ